MKTLITIALTIISILSFAQTDIIEMRSRNASIRKCERIASIKSYDHVASNFGMAPMAKVRTAVLDSVKAISDSVAIMYTSNYCSRGYNSPVNFQFYTDSNGVQELMDTPIQTYTNPRIGSLWAPGADTVRNHPLFSKRHSLDSVKLELDRNYYFNLPSDSIDFIGFDNTEIQSNTNAIHPVKNKRQKKNSIGWELMFMLITPILFMLAVNKFTLFKTSSTK